MRCFGGAFVLAALVFCGASVAAPTVYTLAGVASEATSPPALCDAFCTEPLPASWGATSRRFGSMCLDHVADGRPLLCVGGRVMTLDADGVVRTWARAARQAQVLDTAPEAGGSVLVLVEGALGDVRILRVSAVGNWSQVADVPENIGGMTANSAGGVVFSNEIDDRVVEVRADGTRTRVAGTGEYGFSGDGGLAIDAEVASPGAIAGLPAGGFVFADQNGQRLRRVDAAGVISTIAGGGRGWAEGAPATSVALHGINDLAIAEDSVLVGAARGIVRIAADGTVHTVLARRQAGDPRGIASDGRTADVGGLPFTQGLDKVDVLPDGTITALTSDAASYLASSRLLGLLPETTRRLAVALRIADRRRPAAVDAFATRSATGTLTIRRRPGGKVLSRQAVSVRAGRTRIAVAVPRDGRVDEIGLVVRGTDGARAEHRLTVIGGRTLTRAVLARSRNRVPLPHEVDIDISFDISRCRPSTATRWRCRWTLYDTDKPRHRGLATFALRRDGLVSYVERWRRGGLRRHYLLEP